MEDEIEIIPGLNAPEEPEAVETSEPEIKEPEAKEPEPKEPEEKEAQKYVPLAALHEERMRRKEMADELARIKREHDEIVERLKPKPEPPPDITVDPVTNIDQRLKEQEAFRKQQESQWEASQRAQAEDMQRQQFLNAYQQHAQRFTEKAPDFADAYKHVIGGRKSELIAAGVDPSTADMMVTQEEQFIVAQAFQNGADPAERIYNLAKARGYKKAEQKSIETIEKGQQAKSLSGAGTTPKEADSFEALNEISDDAEFLKQFRKLAS